MISLFFVVVGKLSEYATGPAVVRIDGRTTLTADRPALVSKVRVAPGDRVKQGDLLVQLYASEEAAEFEAVSQEFNDQLSKLLNSPDDLAAREALVSLRMRRDLAKSRLDQRALRAPHDGVVGDVRVRAGQMVEAGMSVLELAGDQVVGVRGRHAAGSLPASDQDRLSHSLRDRGLSSTHAGARDLQHRRPSGRSRRGSALPRDVTCRTPFRCRARWCSCTHSSPRTPSRPKERAFNTRTACTAARRPWCATSPSHTHSCQGSDSG